MAHSQHLSYRGGRSLGQVLLIACMLHVARHCACLSSNINSLCGLHTICMYRCKWGVLGTLHATSPDNTKVVCEGARCTPHAESQFSSQASQNLGQTSENHGHKFSELWTKLLRTLDTSSQKFAKVQILRVKLQSATPGRTSENPGTKFSEVGTQLLRRPWGSISELSLEAPSPISYAH